MYSVENVTKELKPKNAAYTFFVETTPNPITYLYQVSQKSDSKTFITI